MEPTLLIGNTLVALELTTLNGDGLANLQLFLGGIFMPRLVGIVSLLRVVAVYWSGELYLRAGSYQYAVIDILNCDAAGLIDIDVV